MANSTIGPVDASAGLAILAIGAAVVRSPAILGDVVSTTLAAPVGPVDLRGALSIAGMATVAGAVLIGFRPAGRRWARRRLHRERTRRTWEKAGQGRVAKATAVPAGDRLDVVVPAGSEVAELEESAGKVAAAMHARGVRVRQDPANAGRAQVTILRRDPLDGPAIAWPHRDAPRLDLWQPIPVGVDEDGNPVTMTMPERNLLIGGEPGAGKSASLSLVVATAALDPSVKLWLLDGKLVELAVWRDCAERTAGSAVAEAIDVLRHLQAEMEQRYRMLLAARKRKVTPDDGLPLHVVACDELAYYLATFGGSKTAGAAFAGLTRDIVSRGRAAGIIFVGATQKPASDVIPTALRDLFGFRWALRCTTRDASDTILGAGWASQGYSAADVDGSVRGAGYLLHEGQRPVRLRSYYLGDDDLDAIARRAAALRGPGTGGVRAVVGR